MSNIKQTMSELRGEPLLAVDAIVDPGLANQVRAFVFRFPRATLHVEADEEGELRLAFEEPALAPDLQRAPSDGFRDFIGWHLGDCWQSPNLQGYDDFLQLLFYHPQTIRQRCIQLIAMVLSINTYVLDH